MPSIIILTFSYILSQFYRSFLAVMSPVLNAELGMDAAALSLASSAWFLSFAVMQFPIGSWLDRYGPRRTTFFLFLIGCVGGALLFALARSPLQVIVAMALIGVGCAPILMASYFIIAKQFPPKRFAIMAAFIIGIGNLGNVFGAGPFAALSEALGWRNLMFSFAAISLVIAVLLWFILPRTAKDAPKSKKNEGTLSDIFKIKGFWMLLPLACIAYGMPAGIRGLWAGPYLGDVYGLDSLGIGEITFWMALAMAMGNFLYGPIDSFINSRKWIVFTGCALAAISLLGVVFIPEENLMVATMSLIALGLFGVSFPILMAHARGYFPDHLLGRGVTLLNFFSIGGAGLMQFLSGQLYKAVEPTHADAESFQIVFVFYLAVYLAALGVYLFSHDKKPRP